MSRWDCATNSDVDDAAVEAFIDELVEVCRRHNMVLGHEDKHGAFEVERIFTEDRANWLRAAHIAKHAGFDKNLSSILEARP
jgi:hypothetical protein